MEFLFSNFTLILFMFGSLALTMSIYLLGMHTGKKEAQRSRNPGFVPLTSEIKRDLYTNLMNKGDYKDEVSMLVDSITLLYWALDEANEGRYIGSYAHGSNRLQEFNIDTLAKLRAKSDPINFLKGCLLLEMPNNNEDDDYGEDEDE